MQRQMEETKELENKEYTAAPAAVRQCDRVRQKEVVSVKLSPDVVDPTISRDVRGPDCGSYQ